MKITRLTLIIFGICLVGGIAFWATAPDNQIVQSDPKPSKATELRNTPVTEPLSTNEITGAVWIPKACTRPVLEVRINNGQAHMGANCQDGQNTHEQFRDVGLVDTTVPSRDDRGPSFAMVMGEPGLDNGPNGMPSGDKQGILLEVPIVNTCRLASVDTDFRNPEVTTVRSACLDPGSAPPTQLEVNMNLLTGHVLNKERNSVVAIVLRHPDKLRKH